MTSYTKNWTKTNPYAEVSVSDIPYMMTMTTPKGCLYPAFMCRDFLQDVFWVENVNPPGDPDIYSFKHKYTGAKKFYMILEHAALDPVKNIKKLKAFWNLPDQMYPLVPSIKEGMLVLDVTALMSAPPYMVSFVTGLTRVMYFYDEKYETLLEFLNDIEEVAEDTEYVYSKDVQRIQKTMPLIEDTYKNGVLPQSWEDYDGINQVHNWSGFVSFFDKVKDRYVPAGSKT